VDNAHWYPSASFTLPETFELVLAADTVKIASLDPLPFAYHKSDEEFMVKTRDFELSVQNGHFAFNGLNGTASGTVARDE
jgi:hypothetical protein